jgi:hypothetical protein
MGRLPGRKSIPLDRRKAFDPATRLRKIFEVTRKQQADLRKMLMDHFKKNKMGWNGFVPVPIRV